MLPTIVLTMGDPAGVGPEIVLKALADPEIAPLANWIVAGDARILAMAELQTGCPLRHARLHDIREGLEDLTGFDFGKLDARCGTAGVAYVRVATELCLRGEADAVVFLHRLEHVGDELLDFRRDFFDACAFLAKHGRTVFYDA